MTRMQAQESVTPRTGFPRLTLPDGGTVQGYGETFQPDLFTGTSALLIPLFTSPARSETPDLALHYASTTTNSPFGIGFSLRLPAISRRTDTGIPRYDDTDTFLLAGGNQLVPRFNREDSDWKADQRTETRDGRTYTVVVYRPRQEHAFDLIERWTEPETGDSFWQVTSRSGQISLFGRSGSARIADPDNPARVFTWLLEESIDPHGNWVLYRYKPEDNANLPVPNRSTANRYIERILYGNYRDRDGNETFAFEVLFDYGEYALPQVEPARSWPVRDDPFSSYRAGFEIRTNRLCRNILMVHHFPDELGAPAALVSVTQFAYGTATGGAQVRSIQRIGYRRHSDGSYTTKELPPLDLGYTEWHPEAQQFHPLAVSGDAPIPGIPGKGHYQMVDLYGEGLPGILRSGPDGLLYWRPHGNGTYAQPSPLPQHPGEGALSGRRYSLMDLSGTGRLDLVVGEPTRGGFYRNLGDGEWAPFTAFTAHTPEFSSTRTALVDLTGSGLSGLFVPGTREIRYYPSRGESGYEAAVTRANESGIPVSDTGSQTVLVTFADMFGDGLAHRVRISSGCVEVWPNLGHGRFGEKVVMQGAPRFGPTLTTSQILLADVNGSGTADLILIYPDRVELFLNQSGDSFSQPLVLPLPLGFSHLDQPQTADVLGTGLSALVITKAQSPISHHFLDLCGGLRPMLLNRVTNNMGLETRITYRSSTAYYLEDLAAGRPWVTRLIRPVNVIAQIESIDQVSGTRSVQSFRYRDGYYDVVEREFRGFGHIEWQVTEIEGPVVQAQSHPLAVRAWSHTGAFLHHDSISRQWAAAYYRGDSLAFAMPESHFAPEILQADAATIREAYRALAGHRLAMEEYALQADGTPVKAPLTLAQANYTVAMVQPRLNGYNASFTVTPRESVATRCEGEAGSPCTEHTVVLATDAFGNVVRKATVYYPRRPQDGIIPLPDQMQLRATLEVAGFINHGRPFYRVGVPYEERHLELSDLNPADRYFSFEALAAQVDQALANELPYGQPFTPGTLQARLFTWWRQYYWNDDRTSPLPLGEMAAHGLPHHRSEAVLPDSAVLATFGDKVTPQMLEADGGYVHAEAHWWRDDLTFSYQDEAGYYQLAALQDPFGCKMQLGYDRYLLHLVRTEDCLGQVTSGAIDYQTGKLSAVTDCNQNTAEGLYDPLGELVVVTKHGVKDGQLVGHAPLADYQIAADATGELVLANPERYLQRAAAFYYYDLTAWQRTGQAAHSILVRAQSLAYPQSEAKGGFSCAVTYYDARNHTVGQLDLVNRNADGDLWLVQEHVAYDSHGNPVRRCSPYFATTATLDPPPDTPFSQHTYDALQREVQVLTPKGFLTKTSYSVWESVHYDANDTVTDSPYYQAHHADPNLPRAEREALQKAVAFYNTPATRTLNNMGQEIQTTEICTASSDEGGERTLFTSRQWRDISGRVTRVVDPRFYSESTPDQPAYYNLVHSFDMVGQAIAHRSADGGNQPLTGPTDGMPILLLHDAVGKLVHTWDQRGCQTSYQHDSRHRLVAIRVQCGGQERVTDRLSYGSDPNSNTVNQVVQHHDTAGLSTILAYDLMGNVVHQERRVLQDYRSEVDWSHPDQVALMDQTWSVRWTYNAEGFLLQQSHGEGSLSEMEYYANGWLRSLRVTFPGETPPKSVIDSVAYHPSGAPQTIQFGNGVQVRNTYDPQDYRLMGALTESGSGTLQNLRYAYDPAGNVTSASDDAPLPAFLPSSGPPAIADLTYDSLYRLRTAMGRQLVGTAASSREGGEQPAGTGPTLETYTEQYTYDRSSNLTEIRHTAGQSWVRQLVVSPFSNQAVPREMAPEPAQVTQFFDAAGNQLQLPRLPTIAYDHRNQMRNVALDRGGSEHYLYDGRGQRVRKVLEQPSTTEGGPIQVTDEVYCGNVILTQRLTVDGNGGRSAASQSTLLRLTLGSRFVLITEEAGEPAQRTNRYQLTDRLGSVRLEVDDSGAPLTCEEYSPYGSLTLSAGASDAVLATKRYRYSGEELDGATGLYYYGARYYIPELGRWTTPDPAGPVDGLNLYGFLRGNPITRYDAGGYGPGDGSKEQDPQYRQKNVVKGIVGAFTGLTAISQGFLGLFQQRLNAPGSPVTFWRTFPRFAPQMFGTTAIGMSSLYLVLAFKEKDTKKQLVGGGMVVASGLLQKELYESMKEQLSLYKHHEGAFKGARAGMYADLLKSSMYALSGNFGSAFSHLGLSYANFLEMMQAKAHAALGAHDSHGPTIPGLPGRLNWRAQMGQMFQNKGAVAGGLQVTLGSLALYFALSTIFANQPRKKEKEGG